MPELCLGSLCLGSIIFVIYLIGDIGVNKGYELRAQRKFKSKYKNRRK